MPVVWMETALRRLCAKLCVDSRPDVNQTAIWSITRNILEVNPETGLHVPALEGPMALETTLRIKELSRSREPSGPFGKEEKG